MSMARAGCDRYGFEWICAEHPADGTRPETSKHAKNTVCPSIPEESLLFLRTHYHVRRSGSRYRSVRLIVSHWGVGAGFVVLGQCTAYRRRDSRTLRCLPTKGREEEHL